MSPSPDLSSQSPNPPLPEQSSVEHQAHPPVDTSLATPISEASAAAEAQSDDSGPTLRRPPMRPVRPSVPASPTPPSKSAAAAAPSGLSKPVASPRSDAVVPTVSPEPELDVLPQGIVRQQPIPPPSEPKQYRAIGLVRGRYQSSEEEFTSGTITTEDGVEMKAVLLGRVMSLVRNHLDLAQEHLWVVYPRTRETTNELNVQIMGVWEPETLKREEINEDSAADQPSDSTWDTPDEGYFSVRGEVVFYSPDDEQVVVKIQQTPKKNTQKAKAFKLCLRGVLENQKTLGYFWDFQVKRQAEVLVIAEATCIGMTPPKKRSKDGGPPRGGRPGGGFRKPFNRSGGGSGGSGGSRPPGKPMPGGVSGAPVRREPLSKPVKRSAESKPADD